MIPEDVWYIIPAKTIEGRESVGLCSKSKHAKYEEFREAWQLLREASEGSAEGAGEGLTEIPTSRANGAREMGHPAGESAGAEAVGGDRHPTNALGRMEAAINFFKQRLEQGIDPQKR